MQNLKKSRKLFKPKSWAEVQLVKTKQMVSAKLEAYGVNELCFEAEAFLHTQQHPSVIFPTALKAFTKGFFSGSMKSEDFPEVPSMEL